MARKGFTLIELLVVIVIIGILVAIALPNFIKIKDKAKEAEVKQNLHAIQLSLERYAVDGDQNTYPMQVMGGDWTDSCTVWQEWLDNQELSFDELEGTVNPDRVNAWTAAPQHLGDSMIMEAYMPSYPQNPFNKQGGTSLLPRITHNDISWGIMQRVVGGRESNKMFETFGPPDRFAFMSSVCGDTWVHHIFNNPPYDTVANLTKTPTGANPWRSPSGNSDLAGNYSYYPRNSAPSSFILNALGGGAVVGYTLAGYGALRTGGQDVYNRNGEYRGRFRVVDCHNNCMGNTFKGAVPCLCGSTNPPSMTQNDGGSDTIIDGVVITLDSGVDEVSKRTDGENTEG